MITVDIKILKALRELNVSTLHHPGFRLPADTFFEPPCSIKWMSIHHSFEIGAFSYGVSGYFFNCSIGRYCSIGEDVQIGRHPHPMNWFSTSPFFYQRMDSILDLPILEPITDPYLGHFKKKTPPVVLKRTVIGNDVWIGHGAFILPGIKIGTGAVIAAMSVVTKDVPPYAVVAGSPAVVKKYRFTEDRIVRLLKSKWWEFSPATLSGVPVDTFSVFFKFIMSLREAGITAYSPKLINLKELVNHKNDN